MAGDTQECLDVFQLAEKYAKLFIATEETTRCIFLELDVAFGFVLEPLDEGLLLGKQVVEEGRTENEFGLDSCFGVVELGGFLLDGVGDR